MFNKILIANRGEIACRIIRTAQSMGIRCVAVYSDADQHSLHVEMADEAYHIGPSTSRDSYLNIERIIDVARRSNSDAVHPGYGFLSENEQFVNALDQASIVFIGPSASAISAMGSKDQAKIIMEKAKVPTVPGYHGQDNNKEKLKAIACDMGYPVLLKAVAGGGGKGMKIVNHDDEFFSQLESAKREAAHSFGNDHILIEKYLTRPRHVEIQVFTDKNGHGVYLFERDCSVQRRHQKVLEEAPAPGLSDALRQKMGETAVAAAKAINYVGAGTIEFLLDEDDSFYFMEMNTRLQVEHPVTELITGQDLVAWQLLVAQGHDLPLTQQQLVINGHALEARIYAEDPDHDFLPATGTVHYLQQPHQLPGVRIDTGIRQGDDISIYYDPMIAKLITYGENREIALEKMKYALAHYYIAGVSTNINFLHRLVSHSAFSKAQLNTHFIEQHQDSLFITDEQQKHGLTHALYAACLYQLLTAKDKPCDLPSHRGDNYSPWQAPYCGYGWRLNSAHQETFVIYFKDIAHDIHVTFGPDHQQLNVTLHYADHGPVSARARGSSNAHEINITLNNTPLTAMVYTKNNQCTVFFDAQCYRFEIKETDLDHEQEEHQGALTAPMNSKVVSVLVEKQQTVEAGCKLIILEAMKMEHTITASSSGVISDIFYQAGDIVDEGAELLVIEEKAQ